MTTTTPAKATMGPDGKVITGQKGKYAVLGWLGDIYPYHQGALTRMPDYEWEDNHIVGVVNTKREATRLMRQKSLLRDIGDGSYYLLQIYLNS